MKQSRLIVNVYALLILALFAFGCEQSSRAKSGASATDATL